MNKLEKKFLRFVGRKATSQVSRQVDVSLGLGFKEPDYGKKFPATAYKFNPGFLKVRELLKARSYIQCGIADFSPSEISAYHPTVALTKDGYEKLDELERKPYLIVKMTENPVIAALMVAAILAIITWFFSWIRPLLPA